ncbi:MAG: helix-turn-helix transcriptional regulator [Actinomycetota bacterium]
MTDGAGRLGKRLQRILLMLPYVIKNPGVSVHELSERFGVAERNLVNDLELLFFCGLPGYGPGDLIDVSLEGDRVFVGMADYFAQPFRLTQVEALALYTGAAAIAELPGMEQADALTRALAKLARALGPDGVGRATEAAGIDVRIERSPGAHLEVLQEAVGARRRVDLEYYSATRGELTRRIVDPWGLVAALGRWYLVAWDHDASEERMFRADRIKAATITNEASEVPEAFDPDRYRGAFTGRGTEDDIVRLEISPAAARWFADYYPLASSTPLDDGWVAVELTAGGTRWAAVLVLRLGADVRTVEPEPVRRAASELAAAIALRYRARGTRSRSRRSPSPSPTTRKGGPSR